MSADAAPVRIAAMTAGDIDELCALAAEIWRAHYPAIISPAQIKYMLAQRYNPAVVREELARGDLWWDKLSVNERMVGFASYFLLHNARAMKLDKLYVHPAHQRRGYGRMLVDRAVTMARAYGCDALVLAVNKRNDGALAAYAKHGFAIVESVVKDIGGGFVMDDYVMRLNV
ncbi:MAG: GNAT family N-acetyltransferase [Betaproteobacteria bacterium]